MSRSTPRDARALRPQLFGRRRARDIRDPLIEPLWRGDRVIVRVEGETVQVTDADAAPLDAATGVRPAADIDPIVRAIARLVRAESAILDGYLTGQPTTPPDPGRLIGVETMSAGEMTTQFFLGQGVARSREIAEAVPDIDPDAPLAFVAVDLLELDGQSLLDVPLLERKRLLEGVLDETDLVRRTAYVRPPVDPWLATWRAAGFASLAYKAANSRYEPGDTNDAWAIVPIPQR